MSNDITKYTQTHEWAKIEENTVTVGLSEYAIEQLGDIVYLELPSVGDELAKDDPFGIVESVKAASDMYAPLSGSVSAVNQDISDDLDAFKEDTYGRGWLIKIEASDISEADVLMSKEQYNTYLESQPEE